MLFSGRIIIPLILSIAFFAYGILVFRGNLSCFKFLAGGSQFLSLSPDDETLDKTARQSGAVIMLLALSVFCIGLPFILESFSATAAVADTARSISFVVFAATALATVTVIVLQIRTYGKLLRK